MESRVLAASDPEESRDASILESSRLGARGDGSLEVATLMSSEAGPNLVEFFRILSDWSAAASAEIVE